MKKRWVNKKEYDDLKKWMKKKDKELRKHKGIKVYSSLDGKWCLSDVITPDKK